MIQPILHDTFVLAKCAPTFDFSEQVRGNGYRSLLLVVHSCLVVLCDTLEGCLSWKNHVLVCVHFLFVCLFVSLFVWVSVY